MTPAEFTAHVRTLFARLGLDASETITLRCVSWRGQDRWIAKAWRVRVVAETAEGAMRGVLYQLLDLATDVDAERRWCAA